AEVRLFSGAGQEQQDEAPQAISQQLISISGDVRDVQATPIKNVIVHSSRHGREVATGQDGRYTVEAYTDDTLVFTAEGYETNHVRVKGQKNISIKMNRRIVL